MRTCPRCQKTMNVKTQEGITLDACPKCERVFLDCGELLTLSQQRPDIEEKLRANLGQHSTGDKCPECKHTMAEVRLEYMMIERCGHCCGILLSKSTLDTAMHSHPMVYNPEPKGSGGFF